MDLEYDRKFAEMKKYIPFLESMINRLETTSSASNPRQAQLDKIRSLRDLLLDKKKRMKMDNLLKCEQVLINLYLKVEQKDSLPGIQKASNPEFHTDEKIPEKPPADLNLNTARNKLKIAVAKIHETDPDTLPEIARATEAEIACSGSKEPALFHRRPHKGANKTSLSPSHKSPVKSDGKRNYTRVLVSPDRSDKLWPGPSPDETPPYTRRSPRKRSPSYHKKEKKKTKQKSESRKQKNLNITLKVPEESLVSLNTKDILSRIIHCSDGDVDIKTLRELRSQILGELKQTSSTDDISDILLKSYKNKKARTKKDDVEDGELSDSESEAIENIYGSLVVLEDTKNDSSTPLADDMDNRKIQIRLVINSENDAKSDAESVNLPKQIGNNTEIDVTDFETYKDNVSTTPVSITKNMSSTQVTDSVNDKNNQNKSNIDTTDNQHVINPVGAISTDLENTASAKENTENVTESYKPNFYKEPETCKNKDPIAVDKDNSLQKSHNDLKQDENFVSAKKGSDEVLKIPLLNEPTMPLKPPKQDVVSQIDILQALKNEILNENMSLPGAEVDTPSLHQPKLTKVVSATEIVPKKRISIEKYKKKSINSPTNPLFIKDNRRTSDDQSKKQSLKLTEKECERFNFPSKLALDESSDEENKSNDVALKNIYENLAPKSPETEPISDSESSSPIIIPENPVKFNLNTLKEDVDMRKLPHISTDSTKKFSSPLSQSMTAADIKKDVVLDKPENVSKRTPLNDPRIRRDQNDTHNKVSLLPTPPSFPHVTPSMTPNARTYELTPSHYSFENEDNSSRKHVYAPSFTAMDHNRDMHTNLDRNNVPNLRKSRFDSNDSSENYRNREDRGQRSNSIYRETPPDNSRNNDDIYTGNRYREDPHRIDRPNSSNYFANKDTPMTPVHPFGRSDCPSTPSHSFGRSDMPRTPSHPFGRSEMPMTPNHPFGRSEMPRTPSHPFGRSEAPMTPNHYFGRSEMPTTPLHSFGRQDYSHKPSSSDSRYSSPNDPRFSRRYGNEPRSDNDRYHNERNSRSFHNIDGYRDNNAGQSECPKPYEGGRYDRISQREPSVGRTVYRENDGEYKDNYYNNAHGKPPFQRGRSATRTTGPDSLPSSRATSIGRNYTDSRKDNRTSVKPHAGRSFTIDTSINSTFQGLIDNLADSRNNFDYRRQRAASVGRSLPSEYNVSRSSDSFTDRKSRATSVGRSLTRESSIGRSLQVHPTSQTRNNTSTPKQFNRAQSMGRDIYRQTSERSFGDIKAEFASFKTRIDAHDRFKQKHSPNNDRAKYMKDTSKQRVDSEKQKSGQVYSPRKNYRDPRMRRDPRKVNETSQRSQRDDRNKFGIVYSNENIAKGIILKSGSGVKNYKIPKIKRPVEEKHVSPPPKEPEKSIKEKKPDVTSKKEKSNDKSIDIRKPDKSSPNFSKKAIKTGKKSATIPESRKSKGGRKGVIYDSDSEPEDSNNKNDSKKETDCAKEIPPTNLSHVIEESEKKDEEDTLSHIDLDVFNVFKDNLISDPVLDNIDSLIEELDNDLNNSKYNNSDPIHDSLVSSIGGQSDDRFDEISKLIEKDLTKNEKSNVHNETKMENIINQSKVKLLETEKTTTVNEKKIKTTDNQHSTLPKSITTNDDATVTTSEIDKKSDESLIENHTENLDNCSTPDSTIHSNEVINKSSADDGLADSTNEINIENTSNDVTSTNEVSKHVAEKSVVSNNEKDANPTNSIEDFVSILQDKPKLQKLLSMLGEHSDNKIKKKLEMLMLADDDEENTTSFVPNTQSNEKTTMDENVVDKNIDNIEDKTNIEEKPKDVLETSTDEATAPVEDLHNTEITDEIDHSLVKDNKVIKKNIPKKKKLTNKGKTIKEKPDNQNKRLTRADAAKTQRRKAPIRELESLHENIREMFLSDDINVLNATGIRMCRLAKMVDDKNTNAEGTDDKTSTETGPVVVLEKIKEKNVGKDKKKPGPKSKNLTKSNEKTGNNKTNKTKAGPKSKTKASFEQLDPYQFESDSQSEKSEPIHKNRQSLNAKEDSSDSDSDSMVSSQSFDSFESSEPIPESKKIRKRKRSTWKTGVIKPKNKKKKVEKATQPVPKEVKLPPPRDIVIPDMECFTDKTYCFQKHVSEYSCRLCVYEGTDIVNHYKKHHPHSEIPLSRMSVAIAMEAIEQCEELNMQAISKIPADRYVCRFCYKEFSNRNMTGLLESFFWHVVSMHTGEYKQVCYECVNSECPLNLDIPPPPKNLKGQLIGYICGKCNYTQVSLENLKTHVIVRHNDEQTEVYMINLAVMNKKFIQSISKRLKMIESPEKPRVLRSTRSNQSSRDESDDESDSTDQSHSDVETLKPRKSKVEAEKAIQNIKIQSKIAFEPDEPPKLPVEEKNVSDDEVKIENNVEADHRETDGHDDNDRHDSDDGHNDEPLMDHTEEQGGPEECSEIVKAHSGPSDDVFDYPHFNISYTDTGSKEYVCCINGNQHYRTTLLISMKKHVQTKHDEKWDGFCFVCKLIVTTQGVHSFKECLQHFLDKHMDDFPVLEKPVSKEVNNIQPVEALPTEPLVEPSPEPLPVKTYINVRPLSELIEKENIEEPTTSESLPKISSVMSLGTEEVEARPTPIYPQRDEPAPTVEFTKYEEVQAEVMSMKHRVVLDAMLPHDKLVRVYKCAGRFCSFTSDSAENALLHASTHQRIGGEKALDCAYCNFDCAGNAIDLVMHVFKVHGNCKFVCSLCFYRASASQLVGAHYERVHKKPVTDGCVLKTTLAPPVVNDPAEMLTRNQAVEEYRCAFVKENSQCNFMTFTPGKFGQHLIWCHPSVTMHKCFKCDTTAAHTDLINHMKVHGLQLYQCAWCVHGASDEKEMLAHCSEVHPGRQPQAYLRIITVGNKTELPSNNSKMRVLPLANLTKVEVPFKEVVPRCVQENPNREAEKSIDLEKLIALTSHMPDPRPATPVIEPEPTVEVLISPEIEQIQPEIQQSQQEIHLTQTEIQIDIPPTVTPPPTQPISQQLTPVLKIEAPDEVPSQKTDVICLDSDDDEPVALPVVETIVPKPAEEIRVPLHLLMRCGQCKTVLKTIAAFKRHVLTCFKSGVPYKCAYCPLTTNNRDMLVEHYTKNHSSVNNYRCGTCGYKDGMLYSAKKHMKSCHGVSKVVVSTVRENGEVFYIVNEPPKPKEKPAPKRKLSTGTPKKRYGPQEIDQLPINPIMDDLVYCAICEFNTKVRLNMVRHLQFHAEQQPVPQTAPVNPVPHLETNERHFDKMVNLASSSLETRMEKPKDPPTVTLQIPPEAAARYPKYVPERQRHTCGAQGCSYISVDDAMLKRHWEALHEGTNNYHCVHCPPYQHLDTSKPLTASRVIAHLKMHDVRLYACSSCSYYHHKRQLLEKHLNEAHNKKGQVLVVREEGSGPAAPATVPSSAPTMDLKAWQCGLCKFKSMLRPEVVDHCYKNHNSKMQFKCSHCPFRTSTLENVTKHQSKSHSDKSSEVFYYYYREGSIPDGPDGTPRWQEQRQKVENPDAEIKTEVEDKNSPPTTIPPAIDLNLVKKEVEEDNCGELGEFCEPNGLKYKCPLCEVVTEDNREEMQSHLYEELKYRKWGCSICNYKAFHKTGLKDHLRGEHRQNRDPIELPINPKVELWVAKLLDHQSVLIDKNKEKLAKQRIQVEKPVEIRPVEKTSDAVVSVNDQELESAFGPFGAPVNMSFTCPYCTVTILEESAMQEHLEGELTRIRWNCNTCSAKFQNYHEVQFHCKSVHPGQSSRPVEAIRSTNVRAAWIQAVLRTQKLKMTTIPSAEPSTTENLETPDNSLLVVRYEQRVPTPESQALKRKHVSESDSDDDGLVIDDADYSNPTENMKSCPHCTFKTKYPLSLTTHMYRHYNLKPLKCSYCNFNGHRKPVEQHLKICHPDLEPTSVKVRIPDGPPLITDFMDHSPKKGPSRDQPLKSFEKSFGEASSSHENSKTVQKKTGKTVKCGICHSLHLDYAEYYEHQFRNHFNKKFDYSFFNIQQWIGCGYCDQQHFKFLEELRSHHETVHSSLPIKYTLPSQSTPVKDNILDEGKRKAESMPPAKRVARKSTTKLPLQRVAKKSTTKLPLLYNEDDSDDEQYSFYGTKPTPLSEYENITTLMSFCNTMVPFTLNNLSQVIKIDPRVVVKDIRK